MHGQTEAAQVIFGLNPMWLATAIFVLTYVIVMTERINRAIVALTAAGVMIVTGVLSQQEALRGVDFNTLGLLTGMMVIVAITRKSGVFQYLAIWSAKKVKANPWGILVMLSLVTAITSALLDNVTTVLLIVPVALVITEELKVDAYPFLFAMIFSSNIGGTATLIGDPPNIMIGSATGLTFNDFAYHLTPVILVVMAATLVPIYLIWGRQLKATAEDRQRVMEFNEHEAITDSGLLKQCLFVIALVMLAFILAKPLGLEVATIAMFGAAVLLLLYNFRHNAEEQSHNVHSAFGEVEWVTIFFFVGLFIVVHAVDTTGLLRILGEGVVQLTGGSLGATAVMILWVSAVLSAVIDNIPFVATMIPLIKSMAPTFGGSEQLLPLWWSLSLGACLGGNGQPVRFLKFTLLAFPIMLLSIVICTGYVYLRYL
jgi:Na+/H+ antiporter NhaD/arsenite permease-like protein